LRNEQLSQENFNRGIIDQGTKFGHLTFIKDLGYRKEASRDK
jgi:hypothetical protein